MSRTGIVRLTVVALGGLAVVVAFGALVASMRGGGQPAGLAFVRGAGWIVPLVGGAAVGAFSWLILSGTTFGEVSCTPSTVPCPLCGTDVLEDWRMCPYCGESYELTLEDPGSSTLIT